LDKASHLPGYLSEREPRELGVELSGAELWRVHSAQCLLLPAHAGEQGAICERASRWVC